MKRLRIWLKELSLTQQLLTIVVFVVTIFTVFFFVFLSNNINNFVDSELFKLIHNSQNNIFFYLSDDNTTERVMKLNDANIQHILYNEETEIYSILGERMVSEPIFLKIEESVKAYNDTVFDYIYAYDKVTVLYSINRLDSKNLIITVLSDSYRSEFRNALVNSVININVLVVSILFVILTIWVSSLIHPLNLIKAYINKIKNEEDAVLNIDRRDEIGAVAEALVDMENELQKQNRIKEEMVQNISHDLKTPISTIKSYSESIKDGIYPYGSLEASCDVIIEHATRLEKKVYSLIVLNKMGYLIDNLEDGNNLDIKDVIDKVLISLKVIRSDIEIIRKLDDVKFHGEEEPWRILVENLVDNALRYAKSYIEISLKNGELKVTNDGQNISEDRLTKLFKPYEKGTDGQFGLGLSIVYRVASTYGYMVAAENLPDGVCFRVYNNESYMNKDVEEIAEATLINKDENLD